MTTAAERLVYLAGASGQAGILLLSIGAGSTSGEVLVFYSGLPTATASEHLFAERVAEEEEPQPRYAACKKINLDFQASARRKKRREEEFCITAM